MSIRLSPYDHPLPGGGVAPARLKGLEDGFPGEISCIYRSQSTLDGHFRGGGKCQAGAAGMVIAGTDNTDPNILGQSLLKIPFKNSMAGTNFNNRFQFRIDGLAGRPRGE